MSALVAALGCSLMMVVVLAGFAWYALSGRRSSSETSEASALRAEIAELREGHADASSGEFGGGR
ncbi:MAG: hypothetical protein KY454_06275 [Actinobacteria bacterium]|nr:hypothetical protein [Actinomycetota bacterium]